MKVQVIAGAAIALAAILSSAVGGAERVSGKQIARERARLEALVQHVEKGSNPRALALELNKLANNGSTPDIRREPSFHLAGLHRKHKSADKALKTYDELSRSIDDRWGLKSAVALGDMRQESGKLDAAVEAYERILRKNIIEPEAVRAALGVALVLEKRGDRAEARKSLDYARSVAKRLYEHDRKGIADALRAIDAAFRRLRPPRKRRKPSPPEAAKLLAWGNAELARKRYGKALGHYNKLLKDFPEAKEADEGGYKRGLAFYLSGKPDEARGTWEPFVENKPEGPWRGHALVGLVDVYLEHDLNAVKAGEALKRFFTGIEKRLENWSAAEGDAWLRKAVVEYINNRRDECLAALDRAQRFRPTPEEIAKHGIPWGPGRLAAKLREGEGITPAVVRRGGSARARTAIVLGDLYFEMQEYVKARRLFAMLNPPLKPITGEDLTEASWKKNSKRGGRGRFDPVQWLKELSGRKTGKAGIDGATLAQRAYARLREGRTHQLSFRYEAAVLRYGTFLSESAGTPWAPEALLRGAMTIYHIEPEGDRYDRPLEELILRRYPRTEFAPMAAISRALSAWWDKRYEESIRLYRDAMRRYPHLKGRCLRDIAQVEEEMSNRENRQRAGRKEE